MYIYIVLDSNYYIAGFYTVGEGKGISPPSRFQTKFILTGYNILATILLGPQKPPEATSEGLHFPGVHTPRQPPPKEQCALHD